jgi:hypothetical protein
MVIANTKSTNKSLVLLVKNPATATKPIIIPQTKFVIIKSVFREYLSIKVPAYNPQKKVAKVMMMYAVANTSGRPTISTKYQGIAIMLMPWAKPEIILERKSKLIAFLFFILQK